MTCWWCRMYRLEYDVAVGVSNHSAKEAAMCETSQPTEPMPYNNSDDFAIWCKTQADPIDWKVVCALAGARIAGRVCAWVRDVLELRLGDHIAFNNGAVFYYQHAIVSHAEGAVSFLVFISFNYLASQTCLSSGLHV